MTDAVQVTTADAIHTGIRLGLGQTRSLEIWRELGGEIRDIEWARLWREESEALKKWQRQRQSS